MHDTGNEFPENHASIIKINYAFWLGIYAFWLGNYALALLQNLQLAFSCGEHTLSSHLSETFLPFRRNSQFNAAPRISNHLA